MGLEYPELLMRIEETFNLEIEDDLAEIQTVGDLYFRLMTSLPTRTHRPCRTSTTFFAIRKKIIDIAGVARSDISLSTPLRQILTMRQRSELWHEFECTGDLRLPALRTAGTDTFLLIFSAVSGIDLAIYLAAQSTALDSPLLFCICCLGVVVFPCIIGMLLHHPLTFPLPSSCRSIRDLVAATVKNTYGPYGWPSDVLWQELRDTISNVWAVDPERIQPDLRLDDLG